MICSLKKLISDKSKVKYKTYLNIENYWNDENVKNIIQNYPTKSIFEELDNEKNNENRKNIRTKDILDKKNNFNKSIIEFVEYHSKKETFDYLVDKFELDDNLKKKTFGIHDIDNKAEIVVKINVCINYPKFESVRGIHLDKQNSIIFGLFYLKKDNDKSSGANLDIFNFKNKEIKNRYKQKCKDNIKSFNKIMLNKLKHDDLIKLDTIEYKKNNMLWLKNSWNTIHSVTPRENAIEDRIFINIVYMYNN
jgi:hypothetical protein